MLCHLIDRPNLNQSLLIAGQLSHSPYVSGFPNSNINLFIKGRFEHNKTLTVKFLLRREADEEAEIPILPLSFIQIALLNHCRKTGT